MNTKNFNKLGRKNYNKTAISRPAYKKAIPVQISEALTETTTIATLEGNVVAPVGYRVVTGVKGEKYPIGPEVFAQYEAVEGGYAKKKIIVRALQVSNDGSVRTPWGAVLTGKKGDYLIMENKNNMWIVEENIFEETYAIL